MIPFLCLAVPQPRSTTCLACRDLMVAGPEKTRAMYLRERKEVVYENLRDLNFEHKAGKIPEVDYASMKNSLEEEAAAILAEISRLESGTRARVSL